MADKEEVIRGITYEILTSKICHRHFVSVDIDTISDALALLKEDCHNCKLECLLQKYDELKEKYDALLKEQEPRVLTWDEMKDGVKDHRPVFVEEWTEGAQPRCFWGLIECGFEPPEHGYNYPGGVEFNVVDTSQDMWDGDFYGMNSTLGWRAWTNEPSEEQRKAAKWNV